MLLARIRLPNRPGALGTVASVLGAIGANINLVEILEKRDEVETDEFILDLPPSQTVASLVTACDNVPGVQVEWVWNYPRGGGIELDVDLRRRMPVDDARAAEMLVSAAPPVFRAQWGQLLDVSAGPQFISRSSGAPDLGPEDADLFRPFDTIHRVALESGWSPGWGAHHCVVAPLAQRRVLIVGRRGDPPFFGSELARLAHLVGRPVPADAAEQPAPTRAWRAAHRSPVAVPLYVRGDLL